MLASLSLTAFAGTADLPDDVNARIARAKSDAAATAAERARSKLDDGSGTAAGGNATSAFGNGCTIAIGNVVEDKKTFGTSARRETTVIVTGDIIQAGNNCK
jgi:hypothetical protein